MTERQPVVHTGKSRVTLPGLANEDVPRVILHSPCHMTLEDVWEMAASQEGRCLVPE